MNKVNQKLLQGCFDLLWEKIADAQKDYDTSIVSFHDEKGFIWEQEGYKYNVAFRAKKIMDAVPWDDKGVIGSGKIKSAALKALKEAKNLVDWSDVIYYSDINKTKELENALYYLYHADMDASVAFNALSSPTLIGNKYALVTFFFFVKDCQQYEVMRPNNFAWRLQKIGVSGKCTTKCSWDYYEEYLSVLSEVKAFLNERVYGEVTLLDAHTFMWMLWMIENDSIVQKECVAVPDGESYVMLTGKEGRKIAYYTKKYERDPKLRKAAIQFRGVDGYRCEACGFVFEEKYGCLGKDFIEVHHVKPLFSLDREVEINPQTDLVCLCANCHRMIHRKKNAIMTVEELRALLNK